MPRRQRLARRAARHGGGAAEPAPEQAAAAPAQAAAPPEQAPPPAAQASAPAASAPDDQLAELQKLSDLHDQGVLTDEEFDTQKQKILAAL